MSKIETFGNGCLLFGGVMLLIGGVDLIFGLIEEGDTYRFKRKMLKKKKEETEDAD